MPYVSGVAMEHEDRDGLFARGIGGADVESGERFVVWGGDHKIFKVGETEFRGAEDFGAGVDRDVGGIYESSSFVSCVAHDKENNSLCGQQPPEGQRSVTQKIFCFPERLSSAARPECWYPEREEETYFCLK